MEVRSAIYSDLTKCGSKSPLHGQNHCGYLTSFTAIQSRESKRFFSSLRFADQRYIQHHIKGTMISRWLFKECEEHGFAFTIVCKSRWKRLNNCQWWQLLANILTACLMCELVLSNDVQHLRNVSGRSRTSLRFASAFNCAFCSLEWLISGDRFYVFYFGVARYSTVKPERDWFRRAKEGLQFCWTVDKFLSPKSGFEERLLAFNGD